MSKLFQNKTIDWAASIISFLLLVMLFSDQFMFKAATRVSSKRTGMTAHEALGKWFYVILIGTLILFALVLLKEKYSFGNFISAIWAGVCLGALIYAVGYGAMMIDQSKPNGRVSMSVCSYLYIVLAYLIIAKCSEKIESPWEKALVVLVPIIITLVILLSGKASHISIMKEYESNQTKFWAYFSNHLGMSCKVVLCGVVFGIPLGWLAFKYAKAGKIITGILDTIESIPSLALICLMMFPLSSLTTAFPVLKNYGISGVGATPVFCALFCYSLFQIVNSTYSALKVIDSKYIDAAKGMGMTHLQIFQKVEFPIILPVILSGVRISLTATILGVTIGSYIGYGGLGMFILLGISGFKLDIIMLGTIPTILMVMLFDVFFRKLAEFIECVNRKRGEVKL
jgi:osmoprotectant transport system permease protein